MKNRMYYCPDIYQRQCENGSLVSISTVRRHRAIAQERERRKAGNPFLSLPLPFPITESCGSRSYPSHNGTHSTDSKLTTPNSSLYSDGTISSTQTSNPPERSCNSSYTGSFLGHEDIESTLENGDINRSGIRKHQMEAVAVGPDLRSLSYENGTVKHPTRSDIEVDSILYDINDEQDEIDDTSYPSTEEQDSLQVDKSFLQNYGWHCRFFLKHKLTYSAMDELIQRDMPNGLRSWKTICKKVEVLSGIRYTAHDYCSAGHELIEPHPDGNTCSHSDCRLNPAPKKKLVYIKLRERLLAMLKDKDLGKEMRSYVHEGYTSQKNDENEDLEDFYSGEGFQTYVQELEGYENEITSESRNVLHLFLFLSTDGAPAFKSSSKSIWPILVYVGNIPPEKRYQEEFILPVSCIPGNPKNLESFLSPLYDELEELQKGIEATLWDGSQTIVYCHVIHELSDLQARRKLCLLKGVNGCLPCAYCYIKGVRNEARNTLYYPNYVIIKKRKRTGEPRSVKKHFWKAASLPLRDEIETHHHFKVLEDLRDSGTRKELEEYMKNTGIVGEAQIFKRFPSMKPYLSLPVDLMHLLFENIAPFIVNIWLGEVDTEGEHSYLKSGPAYRAVNEILAKSGVGIDPSIRKPRDLTQKGLWKAEEWRTFVTITSLVALHDLIPDSILRGWWWFSQICDLSMRPRLDKSDMESLSSLCVSFFNHFSSTYYRGLDSRLHLMKYTVHLVLHIPSSTLFCGPLVCLSQFSTERYIGIIKGSIHAKNLYAESTIRRWIFQQSVHLCQRKGIAIGLVPQTDVTTNDSDKRSRHSNMGSYEAFLLKGPMKETGVRTMEEQVAFPLLSSIIRYYSSNLEISRTEAAYFILENDDISVWDRLSVQRADEWVMRNYRRFTTATERSTSFFAGMFRSGQSGDVDVYYGRVSFFIEHSFINPVTKESDQRILVAAAWASRGLKVGTQHQVFAGGFMSSSSVFPLCTVEDVECFARNIAVIETVKKKVNARRTRTYFVDNLLEDDKLLNPNSTNDRFRYVLRGI